VSLLLQRIPVNLRESMQPESARSVSSRQYTAALLYYRKKIIGRQKVAEKVAGKFWLLDFLCASTRFYSKSDFQFSRFWRTTTTATREATEERQHSSFVDSLRSETSRVHTSRGLICESRGSNTKCRTPAAFHSITRLRSAIVYHDLASGVTANTACSSV
jgi:hypothetical protein